MKLTINIKDTNVSRRIQQFIKHKKTGNIKIDNNKFIIFDKGKIIESKFDNENNNNRVIDLFSTLEEGKIIIEIQEKQNDYDKIPYLIDYLIIDKNNYKYIAGNADYEKLIRKTMKIIKSDMLKKINWQFDTLFFAYKEKNAGIFIYENRIIFGVFTNKARLSLIRKKIQKLL